MLLRILLFPISLLFIRCGQSPLSAGGVVDPSLLQINVIISRSVSEDGEVNERIEAFVRDADKKTIANPQIQIKVNGKALVLNSGSSNYYGAYPHYQLSDRSFVTKANVAYTFTVVLTNGTEYSLGTIQTQPDVSPVQFSPPSSHYRLQPLTLKWYDLEPDNWFVRLWKSWQGETSATELKLSKSRRTRDEWNNTYEEQGSVNEADYLTTFVGSGSETYTVPVSYFQGPLAQFNTLIVIIDAEKQLDIKKPFLEGSSITSRRINTYQIEVTN
ncbi:hypothetical protein [Spirosoma sp.]|uniref:hypothetical protein n=1 Tax=Spirosoma sp. TaxID=1899569 RepID=UPI003B3A61DF